MIIVFRVKPIVLMYLKDTILFFELDRLIRTLLRRHYYLTGQKARDKCESPEHVMFPVLFIDQYT